MQKPKNTPKDTPKRPRIRPRANSGAGYGGRGGGRGTSLGGQAYGNPAAPLDPGSGAGSMGAGYLGTPGGGAVWIRARRRITHNGVIAADGLSTAGNCRGAGAGGGFLVEFAALNGNGIFRANGGASTHTDSKGGGSGGLIALWTRVPEDTADLLRDGGMSRGAIVSTNELPASFSGTFEANVSLKGGSGGVNAMVGEPGTFCWLSMPPGGTLLMLR